jgi:hypothetical protein
MTSSSSLVEGCVTIPFCHCERSRLSGRACLHAVVLASDKTLHAGKRFGTQACLHAVVLPLDNMRLLQSLRSFATTL